MNRIAIVLTCLLALAGCSGETLGPNRAPVAHAGADQVVNVDRPARLDGSASFDPEGREISYHWELVAVPPEGKASLIEDTAETTQLVPDIPGVWVIRLAVSDGSLTSEPDVAQVRAIGKPCEQDPDCDDGLWCNGDEYCSNGFCRFSSRDCSSVADPCNQAGCDEDADDCVGVPVADGTGCDDGLYCTVDDVCSGGDCGGQTRDCSAAAAECVAGVCNEAGSLCVGEPIADGDLCDDGQYCTVNERCNGGQCEGGQPRDCTTAGGGCVDGVCDETANQCAGDPLAQGILCNDDLFCTIDDSCDGLGNCTGTARDCSGLSNQCNQGSCDDTADQCVALPFNEGNVCDDGLYCTTGETCQSGSCAGGASRDCADSDPCTLDTCDEANDACDNQLIPNPNAEGVWVGGTCTDTVDNDCDRLVDDADPDCQECQGDVDCDDGNPCTTNTCDGNNHCTTTLVGNGTGCDDGRYCTNPDTCTDGICSGPNRDCSSLSDQCNQGVCNQTAGQCERQPIREGQACDDGVYCNVDETCQSGSCTGGRARDCSVVADACNHGYCNEGAGQCQKQPSNDGQPCNDQQFCTNPDTCSGGTCSGPQRDCGGFGDQCNDGICDEANDTCTQQPKSGGTSCNDGIYCNGTDQCDGSGSCGVHTGDPCMSGAPCNRTCNESSDDCFAPPGTACGSPATTDCTDADTCDGAGTCQPNHKGSGTSCDDDIYCNGADQCDGSGNCAVHAGDPCPGQVCDETGTQCVGCLADTDCPPCQWCQGIACENQPDGTDVKGDCASGDCRTGLCDGTGSCGYSPSGTSCGSSQDSACDHADQCDGAGTCDPNYETEGTPCSDGQYCNGLETCNGSGICQTGSDPCPGTSCNENDDQCTECVADSQCGFCMWCESGTGTCVNQPDGTDVKTECSPGDCLTGLCDGNGNCGTDPNGTPCNGGDGNWCNSSCDGSGNCTGNPVMCPDDGNMCNGSESCNSSNGSCQSGPNLPASTYCDGNDLITCDGNGNLTGSETCLLGCNAGADPDRCNRIDPSNVNQDRLCANGEDLVITSATTINTNDGSITPDPGVGIVSSVVSQGGGAREIRVFSFNNIDIQADVTVIGSRALALLACFDIDLSATINVSGGNGVMNGNGSSAPGTGGPGGWAGGANSYNNGEGPGGGPTGGDAGCGSGIDSGGAAGSFGGRGGKGGNGTNFSGCTITGPSGANPYGDPSLKPLFGGSGGGSGGDNDGGPGGGGGGAVQLSAGGTITVQASGGIRAAGGGGAGGRDGGDSGGGGGAGSGGAILIEAAVVTLVGKLAANGGGGGAGYESNPGYTGDVAEHGSAGSLSANPAPGGIGSGIGGSGGDGSAGTTVDGEAGDDNENGGGGGGAAGRIRINTQGSFADIRSGATISPTANLGQCTGFCSQGNVTIW